MAANSISQHLYQYLCGKVGTAKMVKDRRTFFTVKDLSENCTLFPLEFISSGSKAEGLDLPGSDIDIMFMDKTNFIHTEYSDRNPLLMRGHDLIMDTNNAPPGFAQIKVHLYPFDHHYGSIRIVDRHVDILQAGNELVLPNTSLKRFFMHTPGENFLNGFFMFNADYLMTHGPCSSIKDGSADFMFCFKVDAWPREAMGWISRPRLQDWPSEDLISDIINDERSVLLVPIGSKFGAEYDNPYEWRISFSVAEKMLVHSFNHTQILCYAMLKILLKQVIDKKAPNLLCSYFMKTLLFWLIEETGVFMWTPYNLFKCFQACVQKLCYHVQLGYFPNYFILQNNMFEGKIFGGSQTKLLGILHTIYTEGIHFTSRTETLRDFMVFKTTSHICQENIMKCHNEDKAIYPLLKYMESFITFKPKNSKPKDFLVKNTLCLTLFKSNLAKSLLAICFVKECIEVATNALYNFNATNKRFYHQHKSALPYFVLGTNYSLNGWLPLAVFFYQNKQFQNTLKIIDYVCSEIRYKKNVIFPQWALYCLNIHPDQYTVCKRSSFLQRYTLLCKSAIHVEVKPGSVFDKCDFDLSELTGLYEDGYWCILDCDIVHYICFMCHHKLHNLAGRNKALSDLQQVVDTNKQDTSIFVALPLGYLFEAYQKSNRRIPLRNMVKLNDVCQLLLDDQRLNNSEIQLCLKELSDQYKYLTRSNQPHL